MSSRVGEDFGMMIQVRSQIQLRVVQQQINLQMFFFNQTVSKLEQLTI